MQSPLSKRGRGRPTIDYTARLCGTADKYKNGGCRCEACTRAKRDDQKDKRRVKSLARRADKVAKEQTWRTKAESLKKFFSARIPVIETQDQ